jgi:hypothetical protein
VKILRTLLAAAAAAAASMTIALLAAAPATASPTGASPTARAGLIAATDNNGTHICLASDTSFCLDLQNDTFSTNQPIYLWNVNDNPHGDGWNLNPVSTGVVCDGQSGAPCNGSYGPFNSHTTDQRYAGDPVLNIEKTTSTGHNGCIGYDPNAQQNLGELAWAHCGGTGTTTVWVQSEYGDYVSVLYTNTGLNGETGPEVMSTGDVKDGEFVYLANIGGATQGWTPSS